MIASAPTEAMGDDVGCCSRRRRPPRSPRRPLSCAPGLPHSMRQCATAPTECVMPLRPLARLLAASSTANIAEVARVVAACNSLPHRLRRHPHLRRRQNHRRRRSPHPRSFRLRLRLSCRAWCRRPCPRRRCVPGHQRSMSRCAKASTECATLRKPLAKLLGGRSTARIAEATSAAAVSGSRHPCRRRRRRRCQAWFRFLGPLQHQLPRCAPGHRRLMCRCAKVSTECAMPLR